MIILTVDKKLLARELKRLRSKHSLKSLAAEIGTAPSTIWRIEKGYNPTLEMALRLGAYNNEPLRYIGIVHEDQ